MVAYDIWNQTRAPDSLDSHLCWFRLLLSVYHWDVADMNLHKVVTASPYAQLCHGFHKRHALDVADCSSKLNDADVWLFPSVVHRDLCDTLYPILDSLDDVRNYLYCVTKVVASSLLLDDMLVDFACRDVVVSSQGDVQVSLVVAQVQVDFTTIVKNEAFTMSVVMLAPSRRNLTLLTHSFGFMVPASTLR